jgi:uncharacterized protein YggU (UPF0235/DUF167 family)
MLIKVKVFAGCKKDEIVKKKDDEFEVRVKEKAEDGRANECSTCGTKLNKSSIFIFLWNIMI